MRLTVIAISSESVGEAWRGLYASWPRLGPAAAYMARGVLGYVKLGVSGVQEELFGTASFASAF